MSNPDIMDGAFMTEVAYLLLDDSTPDTKYEYIGERVVAMGGASPEHNIISTNILTTFTIQLNKEKRPCVALNSDQRVRSYFGESKNNYNYPDISVFCSDTVMRDGATLINPILIVEVLSKNTEKADRGDKWDGYRRIPTLKYYCLVSQKKKKIEIYSRLNPEWKYVVKEEGVIDFHEVGLYLNINDVYNNIDLIEMETING